MFNFHKPRTYRSTEGCCICRAKSSSSRFTDSRKYERDTMQCFDLKYPRQGEICNACVLLVKRFKRLPVGSKRNWSHIVDAKAGIGPGYSKIQTKYKSERINSRAAAQQQQQVNTSTSPSTSNINNGTVNAGAASSLNGLNFIPEKFSKIFKKTRKPKDTSSTAHSSKRKSANNGWSQNNTQSLPTATDSLDSDYEDTRIHVSLSGGAPTGSTVVQFQTQTRASAYKAQAAAEARKKIIKLGTKRRKCLPPRKHRRSSVQEETMEFFDEEEWRERKSCCGMLYECAALGGALLIDAANYKPCEQHQPSRLSPPEATTTTNNNSNNDTKVTTIPQLQKPIIQTMPAVVQLQPPQAPAPSVSVTFSTQSNNGTNLNHNFKTATTTTVKPTPVLKKHHLFFKRQSECFPQGDMVTATHNNNDTNNSPAHNVNIIKTESEFHVPHQQHLQHQQQHHHQQNSTITLQRHIENAIHSSSPANTTTILTNPLTSSALSISVTSSSSASASTSVSSMPQMPKHSLAKVTTISPPQTSSLQHNHHQHHHSSNSSNSTQLPLAKPNSFLHKIKADTGKIVKHSLEKFNTAVRLKTSDLHEIKPIIRTVDKSYILAKPPTQANIITLNANSTTTNTATATYQSLASYNAAAQQPLTMATLSAASPTSSTSSTSSSTKFSDNSSDSGFDENMLDRKSASPLQEDCEKKILSRPGVQTMFLASGVQIQGQPQNLVLTGNEVAAKILQNRKYSSITTTPITSNPRSHHPTTTAVKIAQISTAPSTSSSAANSGGGSATSMSSAAQAKMRAIYNNNNTIQHENGITTIVPASSLLATTQTAAMQNIAPSTVTITPAPPVGTQYNTQNVISRKLTTANIINLQSNTTTNLSNLHNNTSGNLHHQHHLQHHQQHHHLSSNKNHHNNTTNQKIILLKTSANNTTTLTAAAATYNTLSGGQQQQHVGGGGR
ncbi:mucin-5AC [Calliphora vicina]|uniref:mucin-5AC n=1 Tax=Calliphora vicina TaxID=7373 RepID=UPI00325C2A97